VERVVNVLPQLHVTLISPYFGWMFAFMIDVPCVGRLGLATIRPQP
jgi:hypothetical protein